MSDVTFKDYLLRQMAFSRGTFGPYERFNGVLNHLEKEIKELREIANRQGRPSEWVDIVILGLDGLTRSIKAGSPSISHDYVAATAVQMIVKKLATNELRDWPDWRAFSGDEAIEHDRSKE